MIAPYQLEDNISNVRRRVAEACARAGLENNVLIVGASKTMPLETVEYVCEHRLLSALGENRVQELVAKWREGQSIDWHFIGVLQSNKVRQIVGKVSLIHSVDRQSLAVEIDRQAEKRGLVQDILVQINMGREESKSGYYIEDIECGVEEISKLKHIRIRGLMAVMPIAERETLIELYRELGEYYREHKDRYGWQYLSAGMTNDYELAIEYAHSNIVRIGRAIFGERG